MILSTLLDISMPSWGNAPKLRADWLRSQQRWNLPVNLYSDFGKTPPQLARGFSPSTPPLYRFA